MTTVTTVRAAARMPIWRRAARWLVDDAPAGGPDGAAFMALFGTWLCHSVAGTTTTARAMRHAMARVETGTAEPDLDARLLLLGHGILRAHGRRVDGTAPFASRLADSLAALPAVPARYVGEALLLGRLGYLRPSWAPVTLPPLATGPTAALLMAPRTEIRHACSEIAAATRFGRDRRPVGAGVRSALGCRSLQALSAYDLDLATILLRAAGYAGPVRPDVRAHALEFLLDQQRDDGAFGHYAIELAKIAAGGRADFDPRSHLLLPVTVSVLWTVKDLLVPGSDVFTDFVDP